MKRKNGIFFLLFIFAIAMVGCDGQNAVAPETKQEPGAALGKRTITPFKAVVDLHTITDFGRQFEDENGILHIRLGRFAGDVSGDIQGSIDLIFNVDWDETATGPNWGALTITTNHGTWEGHYRSQAVFAIESGEFRAEGTGDLAGKKLQADFTEQAPTPEDPNPNVFHLSGNIIDTH